MSMLGPDEGGVSILFESSPDGEGSPAEEPAYFSDLNLDQVVAAITAAHDGSDLAPWFYAALHDVDAVRYRQEVLRDLERDDVAGVVRRFCEGMRELRDCLELSRRLRDVYQRQRWFLAAIEVYCRTAARLAAELSGLELGSRGLSRLREHARGYAESEALRALAGETDELLGELASVTYSVRIRGLRVTVDRYDGEPDLTVEVERTFAKFRQGEVEDHLVTFPSHQELNQVEEQILARVALLFPETFEHLRSYCARHAQALDATLLRFDREAQFYLAYLEYIEPLRAAGLRFSYPEVSLEKHVHAVETFDLALAHKLLESGQSVVCNDIELAGDERVLVITGPNQGGKTTFSRTFGQLHHLAALGLLVPGDEARAFLPDQLFTHYERREDTTTLNSKFEEELHRMHAIFERATGDSILIMNESFTSTTLTDAVTVGTRVLEQVLERDMVCVCVTFVDELSTLSDRVVSMMSTVSAEDPTQRTFKVVRKPADGLAYALALAERHGLSHERLVQRIVS